MNSFRPTAFAALLACGVAFPATSLQAQTDCKAVAARLKEMIASVPDHMLTAVEDTLVASPECVCEVVKTAIEASKANAENVRRIVFTAVTTAPESAPAIAECAVAAAPDHADSVRAAFAEAFEDKGTKKTAPSKQAAQLAKTETKEEKPAAAAPKQASPPPTTTNPYAYPGDQSFAAGGIADGGKSVVWESGKQGFGSAADGMTRDAESYPRETPGPGGAAEGIVEPPIPADRSAYAYAGQTNAPGYSSGSLYGGTAIDLSGIYLIPPVASAGAPPREDPKARVSTSGRISPQSPRRPVVRPTPMSPTGP